MKRQFFLALLFPLLLTGCYEAKKEAKENLVECFEVIEQSKTPRPLMVNKCTGDTWILVYTTLAEKQEGQPETFTYRWYPLTYSTTETALSVSMP